MHRSRVLAGAVLTALLAACGGGGDDGAGPAAPGALSLACSGAQCGASDAQTYRGGGVGIWRYDNSGSRSRAEVPVTLNGVSGRSVMLIFTNVSDQEVSMPSIGLQTSGGSASVKAEDPPEPAHRPGFNQIPPHIREYRPPLEQASQAPARQDRVTAAVRATAVGDKHEWMDSSGRTFPATLERRWPAHDGRMLNLWVQDRQSGDAHPVDVPESILDDLVARFSSGPDSVYPIVTDLAGAPWGPTVGGGYIGPNEDLHIVLSNLTPDGQAWGLVGYFFSANTFLKSYEPLSNEALALFVDTETLTLGGEAGRNTAYSTLAHEMTHMVNFYQRAARTGINPDNRFALWLEETSALMMEDIASGRVLPGFSPLRDSDFSTWLSRSVNCDYIREWDADASSSCFSYPIANSFGGYLLRQHGIGFYRNLLRDTSSTDSFALLDHAIRQAGGAGARAALRDWGAAIALLPAAPPAGFGHPARAEGGYSLPAVNGRDYAASRRLPGSVPATLKASGHFPVERRPGGSIYSESITVPAGSALTIVVQ
ncbi:MAG: hemagglutinin [Pigmentiphaga sp.]|uniref:M30 family zinc metallopeptidase n=1 Tax=Pigmentiphaga sp. TaxID=1977564 RepID=UPI0029A9EE4F|nr:hemagglutinin [Pigmentiphaga sp.]MDX3904508.1 hemagglutinin [Pigmentiphaga sp.]